MIKIQPLLDVLNNWQSLVGAFIGAMAPIVFWFFKEKYIQCLKRKESVYYLIKVISDEISLLLNTKKTINNFVNNQLDILIERKALSENTEEYVVDLSFFPLFEFYPIADDVRLINTGSGYIDNKLIQAYQVSKSFPSIIHDLRYQFDRTLSFNKEICFNKLNKPQIQASKHINNLKAYKDVLEREMVKTNIPFFLKLLTETLVALNEFVRIGKWRWQFKFNPRYKFYITKSSQKSDEKQVFENIELFFQQKVNEQLQHFNS